MSQRTRAVLSLIAAAVLWSLGGVFIKLINWHPLAIAGMRSAIAAAMYWAILRKPKFNWSVAQIGGGVAYAVTVLLYVTAVKMTTAANAILLQYTAPMWVAVCGIWFLHEKPKWLDWVSVVVSLAGMVLFFREGLQSKSLLGDVLAALSGFTIAWMTLFLRKQKDARPIESVLLGNLIAAVCGLPFMFGAAPDLQGWLGLLFLGVFQLGLSYLLYATALRHVAALEAMLFSMLEPILNPVWVSLLIGEVPGVWALLGGLMVVLSVAGRAILMATQAARARFRPAAD
jgi:drug/metabolite transporter (DMT)-like permease